MLIATVSGCGAFIGITSDAPEIAKWLALTVAVISLSDIVLGWPVKARKHEDLYRQFHQLLQSFNLELARNSDENDELSSKKLAEFQNHKLEIEADEPSALDALNVVCHNVQVQSEGHLDSKQFRVRWYQRIFADICTLPPNDFGKKPAKTS